MLKKPVDFAVRIRIIIGKRGLLLWKLEWFYIYGREICRMNKNKESAHEGTSMQRAKVLVLTGIFMLLLLPGAHGGITLTTLVSFAGTNGATPFAALIQGADGNFYGTTQSGGDFNKGTVFQLSTNGTLTTLATFDGTNGATPCGLVQSSDGSFYGTTQAGGTNAVSSGGLGTVFRITTNGSFTSLMSFAGTNGANPMSGLMRGSDGNFYGTTYHGGSSSFGAIYRFTSNNTLDVLASLDFTNGWPVGGLVESSNGNFYGTSTAGRSSHGGLFQVTSNGTVSNLATFLVTNTLPQGALVQGKDGNFYGTSVFGAGPSKNANNRGTIFSVTPSGTVEPLYTFIPSAQSSTTFPDGAAPYCTMIQDAAGNFYGTASAGGWFTKGVVFELTSDGTFVKLAQMNGTNGANPYSGLIVGTDGNFYGVAKSGGAYGQGSIFVLGITVDPPVIQSIRQTNNSIAFSWSAVPGKRYQVQSTPELVPTNWNNLGGAITATNGVFNSAVTSPNVTLSASDLIGASSHQFYRVVVVP
ncbi:MAG: hypothetical protein JWR69_1161 [Pedosphaera sp.]|nr:hypothetical protein [Pedosphaera sp.]